MKNILILSAHPDDETLGCGGTIHRLSNEGNKIHLLTFTDGESSRENSSGKNRNKLLEKISEILGIDIYSSANFPDNSMDSVPLIKICKYIETQVKTQPDIIFTHNINDLNIDHQIICKATMTVFRPQKCKKSKFYSYYVPSSTEYNPFSIYDGQTYFRLDKVNIDAKLNALKEYDSEMRSYPHSRSYDNIDNLMKVWGSEVGCNYAEKFKNLKEII